MKSKIRLGIHNWRNSLVGQLLLRLLACLLIFFSIIGFIQYNSLKSSLYQSVAQNLLSDYQSIRYNMLDWLLNRDVRPGKNPDLRPGNFAAFYTTGQQLSFLVQSYGNNDDLVLEFLNGSLGFDLSEKANQGRYFVIEPSKNNQYMLLVEPISQPAVIGPEQIAGYAVIGEPLAEKELILNLNIRGYIVNTLLILLLSTLVIATALQKPLTPLLQISTTARKIAAGQYNLRIPKMNTASEIEQLSEALNHMLEQMEKALNSEKTARDRMARFIADASHELRTPLTSIRGFLEILTKNTNKDPETLAAAHQTMLLETERLIRLTEGLLTLNRFSPGEHTVNVPEEYRAGLPETLSELLPLLLPLLEKRILRLNTLEIRKPEDLYLPSSGSIPRLPLKTDELKQVLFNLIHNAISYTNAEGTIELLAETGEDRLTLSVVDNGKGIPPKDLPHIFERFFRGDRSRSHNATQGAGLGLAIVAQIVRLRGGEIKVDSTLGAGTAFTITFPQK